MAFDLEKAKAEGYTSAEIADYLGKESKFKVDEARSSGYDDDEIVSHLVGLQTDKEKPVNRAIDAIKSGVSFMRDAAVDAFDNRTLSEKGLLKPKAEDSTTMSPAVNGVPFRADYVDKLKQQDRIAPKSIDALQQSNRAGGRAADVIINERPFNQELNDGTNAAFEQEAAKPFDERMKQQREIEQLAKIKAFQDTQAQANETGNADNALRQATQAQPTDADRGQIAFELDRRERGIIEPTNDVDRYWRDFQSGTVGSTGAALSFIGKRTNTQGLSELGDSMDNWSKDKAPAQQTFSDKLVNGIGSMASFYVPGIGVAKGAQALSIISPVLAKWTGAGTMAALEASAEADGVYKDLIQQGSTDEEAMAKADVSFLSNMALLGVTNKVAFFNDIKMFDEATKQLILSNVAKKGAVGFASEGIAQEAPQQMISNYLTDKPLLEGVVESALIGGIVGGGAAVVGGVAAGPSVEERKAEKIRTLPTENLERLKQTASIAMPADVPVIEAEIQRRANTPTLQRAAEAFERMQINQPAESIEASELLDEPSADQALLQEIEANNVSDTIAPAEVATETSGLVDNQPIGSAGDSVLLPDSTTNGGLDQNADALAQGGGLGDVIRDGNVAGGALVESGNALVEQAPIEVEPDYSTMSYEQLQKVREDGIAKNKELDIAAIRKYAGDELANEAQSWPQRKIDKWFNDNATTEMEQESSAFQGVDTEKIDEYSKAVNDFDETSPETLGASIALKMRDIDKPYFEGSPAFVTIKNALAYSKEQGWNESDVLDAMREKAFAYAGDDAPELFERLFKIQPQKEQPKPTLKTIAKKPTKKSGTLLATLRDIGGISIGDKQDVTGEGKSFAPGGYNQVFKQASKQTLRGAIESGALDDFLPPAMRLSSINQGSDAFDSAEAYDYLGEKIRNGERVINYDVEQEIKANEFYQADEATAQADIDEQAFELLEDEINEQLRTASYEERETSAQAKQFIPDSAESYAGSSAGTPTGNQSRIGRELQPKTIAAPSTQSAPSQEREGVRDLVTALVKRRAAANELGKAKQFDEALQLAKDFMAGKDVKPAKFLNAALNFNKDLPTRDAFNALQQLAKAPASEVRKAVANVVDDYKAKITAATTEEELTALGTAIQKDKTLSDAQAIKLDDAIAEAQDQLENAPDNSTTETTKPTTNKADLLGDDTSGKQAIADAERAKDDKRNSGKDNAGDFNLTGSDSESDKAAGAGAQPLFSRGGWNPEKYSRVMPRDLFNEAKTLAMSQKIVNDFNAGKLPEGFEIELEDESLNVGLSEDGSLYLIGLNATFNGNSVQLTVPYNSGKTQKFPLEITDESIDAWSVSVFDSDGNISDDFKEYFGETASQPTEKLKLNGKWETAKKFMNQLGSVGLWEVDGVLTRDFVFDLKKPEDGFKLKQKGNVYNSSNLDATLNGEKFEFYMNLDDQKLRFKFNDVSGEVLSDNREMSKEFEDVLKNNSPQFSRSLATKEAYQIRIDELFKDEKASFGAKSAIVLDKSDVLVILGYGNKPVYLNESKVVQGKYNHKLTAAHWKKVPEWLENPAMVFDSDTVKGRLTFIAPETINGAPIRMIVEPDADSNGLKINLLINSYDAQIKAPYKRWIDDGLLRYYSKEKSPAILARSGLQLSSLAKARSSNGRILVDSDLVKYRAKPALSRAESFSGMLKADVQSVVDNLSVGWTNAPQIVVVTDMADSAIPEEVRTENERQLSQGAEGQPEGFFYKDKVYVVANEMTTEADIARVLFHETLGHFGLHGTYGKELKKILNKIAVLRRPLVIAKAKQYGLDINDARDRLIAAEEVLAEMAQANPKAGIVKRAIAAIRQWLRDNGFKLKLTDDDIIVNYLLPARQFVEGGRKEQSTSDMVGAFSRADQTQSEAFKKWFGDSKVVDADGKPLVVYHGTEKGGFNTFDRDKIGENTGNATEGFYFTENLSNASTYSGSKNEIKIQDSPDENSYDEIDYERGIYPVYLKLENPLEMDFEGHSWDGANSEGEYDGFYSVMEIEDMLKDGGYDGAILKNIADEGRHGQGYNWGEITYIALKPSQIKSATQNNGNFDSNNNDIRFSRAGTSSANDEIPAETNVQAIQRIGQDKFNRFKVLQDWLIARGVQLSEDADVYLAEGNMTGRISVRKDDFRDLQVQPLVKKTQAAGLNMEQIGDFLKVQHAPEANKRARELQGQADATAFGVTDADAKTAMDEFKALPNYAELKQIANEWRAITNQTKQIKLQSGLLTDEMVKAWEDTYDVYVPVKGNDDVKLPSGTGSGLDVKVRNKQRLGHGLRDEAIIENILRDHESAISLDEKNIVGKALIKFALEAKNDDIITIAKPEKRKVLVQGQSAYMVNYHGSDVATFDSQKDARQYVADAVLKGSDKAGFDIQKTTDPVRVMLQASPQLADNEVTVYVAGHAVRLQINDEIAAREYKNMGVEHLNTILSAGREVNNWLSKAYTGYSPDFIFTNPIRDAIQGAITLTGNLGGVTAAKIYANYPVAVKELVKHFRTKGSSKIVNEYRMAGGSTGGAYLSDLERIGNDIQSSFNEYQGMLATYKNTYDKAIAEGKSKKAAGTLASLKSGAAGFKKIPIVGHFMRLMENINSITENALRVATFKTLTENGFSKPKAAAQAKNLMNFNRKGEQSNAAGALYLFFNPSVQGTKLIQEALFTSPHKRQAQALAGSMVLTAFTMAMMALNGDDEDKKKWNNTPDYIKDGNLVFNMFDTQFTITMPYGYRTFWTLGNVMADATQKGADFAKLGNRMASSVFANFSPIGNPMEGENGLFQAIPTTLKMALAPGVNEDSFGMNITPKKWNESTPDSQLMNRGTHGSLYDGVSEKLNDLSGGSRYEAGMVDVSPETLKFWVKSLTGGAGQFAFDSINIINQGVQGVAPQDFKDIPVVRKFVREPGIRDARSAFWERKNEADLAAGEFAAAKQAHDRDAMMELRKENGALIRMAKMSDRMLKMANAKRKAVSMIQLDKTIPLSERIKQTKEIENEELKIYNKYISIFDAKIKE